MFRIFVIITLCFFVSSASNNCSEGFGPGVTRNFSPNDPNLVKFCGPNQKQCGGSKSKCVPLDTVCCGSGGKVCGNHCINEDLICCDENTKPIFCSQDRPVCCPLEDFPFPGPSCTETLELCNCVRPMFEEFYPDIPVCDESVFPVLNASKCYAYEEIIESECPAELALKTCEPYECIECIGLECSQTNTLFPYNYSGCEIIDCNTIICDETGQIHIDKELSWIDYKIGEEFEVKCYQ